MRQNDVIEIPVLMYHEIIDEDPNQFRLVRSPYTISLNQFRAQMSYLHQHGYSSITLSELVKLKNIYRTATRVDLNKLVVITFDDGYKNNVTHALPVLKKNHLVATFFVIVSRIGTRGYLSWDDLRKLIRQGMAIQSHTLNHVPLEILSDDSIEMELVESKRILEQSLKRPVDFISLPHGSYTDLVFEITRRAGFEGCCTSDFGYFKLLDDPFQIKRIDVRKNYRLPEFEKILQKNRLFIARLRLYKKVKTELKGIVGIQFYNKLYHWLLR